MCNKCQNNYCNGGCNQTYYQETHICNECNSEPVACDCPILDFSTDCSTYKGDDIVCGETTVVENNTILTDALENIVSWACNKFDEIQDYFVLKNVGGGVGIYKGISLIGEKELKSLTKTGNILLITPAVNGNEINFSLDETNLIAFIQTNQKTYSVSNVGTGGQIYKDSTIVGNNTQFNLRSVEKTVTGQTASTPIISDPVTFSANLLNVTQNTNSVNFVEKTIKTNTLKFVEKEGAIFIDTVDFNYIKEFYVNSNYVPTPSSPSDGSVIRPYINYDEAKTAVIGTGTLIAPQFPGATIILQTSSSTANNPTVNTINIKGENYSTLTYTGTDNYMIDSEILYPLIPKNSPRNDLSTDLYLNLTGKLTLTRTNGIGIVRGIGANRNGLGQVGDKSSIIKVGFNETDEIFIKERETYPSSIYDGDVTSSDNVTTYESIYGFPHKYTTQLLPTTPLIYTEYNSVTPQTWAVQCYGKVSIETVANTAIKIGQNTIFFADKIYFKVNGKLVSTTSGTKLVDRPYVYQPQPDRNFVEGEGRYYVKETIIDDKSGYSHIGVDNFFKFTDDAYFDFGTMNIATNMYVNKFFNISDVSNTISYINISNELKGSNISMPQGRYFIDTNQASLTLNMPHSNITGFSDKSTSVVTLIANTLGTMSSFFNNPVISGIGNYANDLAAQTAGLIQNSLYFNTTNNAIDKV